jgi:GDP-4-dehydro-6-deoxy-D-mannose reductase
MRVLVTGASGFTGRHVLRHIASVPGGPHEIVGTCRSAAPSHGDGVVWAPADLLDREGVAGLVRDLPPDLVVHLAGLNRGPLDDLLRANVVGTEHLLDAVLREAPGARVLVVGSSAEYGYAGDGPIGEDAPLRPVTPYGVSKAAQSLLALSYHARYGLPVAVAVSFNLIGPGLPASFVGGRIVAQALEVSRGERAAVELRGTDSRRDFVDVRDAAAAYLAILCADRFDERVAGQRVNVGSGVSRSVAELLEVVCRALGGRIGVALPGCPPPDPVPAQTAAIGRIQALAGWSPGIAFETSIRDMLRGSTPC